MTNSEVNQNINFDLISNFLKAAEDEGRYQLHEHETYGLLNCLGCCTPPATIFLEGGTLHSDKELAAIPGDRVVLKIISPRIVHKTELGGVKVVEKSALSIRQAVKLIMSQVPDNYARMFGDGIVNDSLAHGGRVDRKPGVIEEDIKGVLLVQYVPFDPSAFGNELIVGIKNTHEVGMTITAGIGGTDTELFADTFRRGHAFATASTAMTAGEKFLRSFKQTVIYKKLAGLTRGQKPVYIDTQLLNCLSAFIKLANYFSPSNPHAPYVIDVLEVNPFIFSRSHMVPLDGLCKFSRPELIPHCRPWHKIDNLLHPKSIGIIGVSTTRVNFGQIILNNIIANGYEKGNIRIIRPGMKSFRGVTCVPDLERLDKKLDLLVVAVGAEQVPAIVETVTEKQICESVMLIPGGIGETGESKEMAGLINDKIKTGHLREDSGPVFLGANCLGVVSHPGKYDTLFIPDEKLPKQRGIHKRNVAFISQSGAFMITRLSKLSELDPAYMVSIGNQNDLTLGDMMSYMKDRAGVDVIAVYAEGFKDLDGLIFIKALKEAVGNGKDVIVYKAGKTTEGKNAAGSHTASIAGDYKVFESCVQQAGGIVASSFTQFEDLLMLAKQLNRKRIRSNRIAALSGAGFEAVGMADNVNVDGCHVELAALKNKTEKKLETLLAHKGLTHLTEVKNPMDINPGADDEAHILAVKYLAEDDNVDAVIAGLDPLSPATRTLIESKDGQYDYSRSGSIVMNLPVLVNALEKPVIGVVDAGRLYDPMVHELTKKGMAIFRSADRAVRALAVYIAARLLQT
jgi:acyl-CoA synthetase (NDP forming)